MISGKPISYFNELNNKQLRKIESIAKTYNCINGDVVYLQGEYCQNWIIILDGNFLSRKKSDEVIDEKILLTGDSFDFDSVFKQSVTSRSLEAIGNSSLMVIDILGLKQIYKSFPHIIGLVRESLTEEEKDAFDICIKNNGEKAGRNFKIRKSFKPLLYSHMLFIPLIFLLGFLKPLFPIYIGVWFITLLIRYFLDQLVFIEINAEVVAKKSFKIFTGESKNYSAPMDKVVSTSVNFKNRILKVLKLGEININTSVGDINLKNVSNPVKTISYFNRYRESKVTVNNAIDLTSFRNLFSKKNGSFYIESQLNTHNNQYFRFKKSILVFIIRSLPPVVILILISILLYVFLKSAYVFSINILTAGFALWQFVDWINDVYAFEGSKVIDIEKKPLWGKENRTEADLSSVQSIIKVQKNFVEYIFNYGTIEIELIGQNIIYPFIHNPDKVIENLYLVKKYYYAKKKSQEKLERQEEFLNYNKYLQELTR